MARRTFCLPFSSVSLCLCGEEGFMSKMTFEVALKEPLSGLILFEELHSRQWFVERADPRKFFRYKLGQQYELRFGLASLRLIKPEKRSHDGKTSVDQRATDCGHPRGAQEQAHA